LLLFRQAQRIAEPHQSPAAGFHLSSDDIFLGVDVVQPPEGLVGIVAEGGGGDADPGGGADTQMDFAFLVGARPRLRHRHIPGADDHRRTGSQSGLSGGFRGDLADDLGAGIRRG
jgi:hypothetical protein